MKKVETIINRSSLEEVTDALKAIGIDGIVVSSISMIGQASVQTTTYRSAQYAFDNTPKVKLEMIVDESQVDDLVDAICENTNAGNVGEGEILVLDLTSVIRTHTGKFLKAASADSY